MQAFFWGMIAGGFVSGLIGWLAHRDLTAEARANIRRAYKLGKAEGIASADQSRAAPSHAGPIWGFRRLTTGDRE